MLFNRDTCKLFSSQHKPGGSPFSKRYTHQAHQAPGLQVKIGLKVNHSAVYISKLLSSLLLLIKHVLNKSEKMSLSIQKGFTYQVNSLVPL